MDCWVGHVGWPIADGLTTEWSPIQLASSLAQYRESSAAENSVLNHCATPCQPVLVQVGVTVRYSTLQRSAYTKLNVRYVVDVTKDKVQGFLNRISAVYSNIDSEFIHGNKIGIGVIIGVYSRRMLYTSVYCFFSEALSFLFHSVHLCFMGSFLIKTHRFITSFKEIFGCFHRC